MGIVTEEIKKNKKMRKTNNRNVGKNPPGLQTWESQRVKIFPALSRAETQEKDSPCSSKVTPDHSLTCSRKGGDVLALLSVIWPYFSHLKATTLNFLKKFLFLIFFTFLIELYSLTSEKLAKVKPGIQSLET